MSSISDYVLEGGQSLTAGEVHAFRGHLAAYKLKVETLESPEALREQASFLLRFIEDVLDDAYVSDDFAALPEAIFAVRYLAKGVDIIPDSLPGGFRDDEAVLRAVFEGHATEFRNYCKQNQIANPLPTT
jgi:uncharacterized membrane protein YkvA (DUF1232 family)